MTYEKLTKIVFQLALLATALLTSGCNPFNPLGWGH
jgi:predicted small secreted protein